MTYARISNEKLGKSLSTIDVKDNLKIVAFRLTRHCVFPPSSCKCPMALEQQCTYPFSESFEFIRRLSDVSYHALAKRGRLKGREVVIQKISPFTNISNGETHKRTSFAHLHGRLHHPNIVALLCIFPSEVVPYQVIEFCSGGSLEEYLGQRQSGLSNAQLRSLLQGSTSAVSHLQAQGILHRNINASTIYMTPDRRFKLGDFRHSILSKECREAIPVPRGPCTAPEVLAGKHHTYASEVWSVGALILTASFGKSLPSACPEESTKVALEGIEPRLRGLLSEILQLAPSERPLPCQILADFWLGSVAAGDEGAEDYASFHRLEDSSDFGFPDLGIESTGDVESNLSFYHEPSKPKRLPAEILKHRTFRQAYRCIKRHVSDPLSPRNIDSVVQRAVSEQFDPTPTFVNEAFLHEETDVQSDTPLKRFSSENHSTLSMPCSGHHSTSFEDSFQGPETFTLKPWSPQFVPSILTPKVYGFPGGTVEILQSRYLYIESRSNCSPFLVDPTGTFVRILDVDHFGQALDDPHTFFERGERARVENLPACYISQYMAVTSLLEELKSRTPMLTMHVVEGKCMMMCNSPLPDIELLVRSSSRMPRNSLSIKMLRVRLLRRSTSIEFAQRITLDSHSEWQKKLYSCQQRHPFLDSGDEHHLDTLEKRSLGLLDNFLRLCELLERRQEYDISDLA